MIVPPASIVVLGGGTAGWMAACLIAHRWPRTKVTVVESPDIGIIGVGEGSTPQLKVQRHLQNGNKLSRLVIPTRLRTLFSPFPDRA